MRCALLNNKHRDNPFIIIDTAVISYKGRRSEIVTGRQNRPHQTRVGVDCGMMLLGRGVSCRHRASQLARRRSDARSHRAAAASTRSAVRQVRSATSSTISLPAQRCRATASAEKHLAWSPLSRGVTTVLRPEREYSTT